LVYVRGRTHANGGLALPWEDAAAEYAALVTAWWQGGCANIEK
jgi:hypothetical protein